MKFSDIIDPAKALLQRQGRITYRSLKREFDLEDEALEDLKFELIDGQELAVDKDGKMLVWKGAEGTPAPPRSAPAPAQPPASYTPPHLAERIRAEQAAMEARGASDGERKTITALFADLKGSTALLRSILIRMLGPTRGRPCRFPLPSKASSPPALTASPRTRKRFCNSSQSLAGSFL
ncbi:MAG: hypothetical protein HY268_31700 [Deltaproteobacteria bacterium]|nr:hypothetical protein [Deltaproteobacteria bacterium]